MKIARLLADYELDLLKARLEEFPAKIKIQKAIIREYREANNDAQSQLGMLEADMLVEISAEKDANTGKPLFGNDKAREAELTRRKFKSQEYQTAASEARSVGYTLEEAQDELEKLYDQYKSARYISNIVTAEIKIWATDEEEPEEDARFELTEKGAKEAASSKQLY